MATTATYRYRVGFDRIGRTHTPPPLVAVVDVTDGTPDVDHLAKQVYDYARRYLGSRDVEVHVELDDDHAAGTGEIICGLRTGGTFTLTRTDTPA